MIGKSGETIKSINQRTGAYVFIEWPQIAADYIDAMNRLTITDDGGVRRIQF